LVVLVFSSVGNSNTSQEALISKYNKRGRGAYRGSWLPNRAGKGGQAASFLVGEQGRQLRESRGQRASTSRGRANTRAERKRRPESRGGRGAREQVWPSACSPFFPRALLFYRALSLSFLLPRALCFSRPRALPPLPFFLPVPAPGRLNRTEATLRNASLAKATPYSPKSGRHRRPASLLALTPKRRFGDAPRTP
jgi:hypothetical protein